jgi:hypothetical protein
MARALGLLLALAAAPPAVTRDSVDDLKKQFEYDAKAPWRRRRSSSTSGTGRGCST